MFAFIVIESISKLSFGLERKPKNNYCLDGHLEIDD